MSSQLIKGFSVLQPHRLTWRTVGQMSDHNLALNPSRQKDKKPANDDFELRLDRPMRNRNPKSAHRAQGSLSMNESKNKRIILLIYRRAINKEEVVARKVEHVQQIINHITSFLQQPCCHIKEALDLTKRTPSRGTKQKQKGWKQKNKDWKRGEETSVSARRHLPPPTHDGIIISV